MNVALDKFLKVFKHSEKTAGLVLLACTILSLVLANSPVGPGYMHSWHLVPQMPLKMSLEHWINDGLMTVFFLMVGLEIERELYGGELSPIRKAMFPLAGALGGMLVPALIFIAINFNTATLNGFGIPMGTDIAFALAILSLCGKRVPVSIKILLTAIAIIDDLGSILIIAFFYGSPIHVGFLLSALVVFVFLLILNKLKVKSLVFYLIPGVMMWYLVMRSGIHPTISGVLLAFVIPFGDGANKSPSSKLEHFLQWPVLYLVLPLFTLANTAVPLNAEFISALSQPHAVGIGLGLVLGKPVGILLTFFVLTRLKIVNLPDKILWRDLLAMGCLAGIGFTMSIFITHLAFSEELQVQSSKMMILLASTLSGALGFALFYFKRQKS